MANRLRFSKKCKMLLTKNVLQVAWRRLFVLLGLLTIVSLFIEGCTSPVRLTANEVRQSMRNRYISVTVPSRIDAVIPLPCDTFQDSTVAQADTGTVVVSTVRKTPGQSILVFDSAGGELDRQNMTITGHDTTGAPISLSLDTLQFVRFKRANGRNGLMVPQTIIPAYESAMSSPGRRVSTGRFPCWDDLKFGKGGGIVSQDRSTISGLAPNGIDSAISLDGILHTTYYRRNWIKTIRWASTISVTVAIGLGLLRMGSL